MRLKRRLLARKSVRLFRPKRPTAFDVRVLWAFVPRRFKAKLRPIRRIKLWRAKRPAPFNITTLFALVPKRYRYKLYKRVLKRLNRPPKPQTGDFLVLMAVPPPLMRRYANAGYRNFRPAQPIKRKRLKHFIGAFVALVLAPVLKRFKLLKFKPFKYRPVRPKWLRRFIGQVPPHHLLYPKYTLTKSSGWLKFQPIAQYQTPYHLIPLVPHPRISR